jgi:hypothetical protein
VELEILSPEETVNRLLENLADYEKMGIPAILLLVIDLKNGRHLRYRGGALEPLPSEPFDLAHSAYRFDLARDREVARQSRQL